MARKGTVDAKKTADADKHAGYRIDLRPPKDKDIRDRDRLSRLIVFVVSIWAIFATASFLVGFWGSMAGHQTVGRIIGIGLGGVFAVWFVPARLLIYNPEWTGYVTQNMFTGTMVPYGPGLHLTYPWEQRNKRGNYPLKVITRAFTVGVATEDAKVIVSVKYEYAIDLVWIVRAIGVDVSTIETGITAFISSFVIAKCAGEGKTASVVRASIAELNKSLATEFMNNEVNGENLESFGSQYGFFTVSVVIDNIAFDQKVQETRDSIDEAKMLHIAAAEPYGFKNPEVLQEMIASGRISVEDYNKMLNRAMTVSGNATRMDINVLEADIPALTGKILRNFIKDDGGKKDAGRKKSDGPRRPSQVGKAPAATKGGK